MKKLSLVPALLLALITIFPVTQAHAGSRCEYRAVDPNSGAVVFGTGRAFKTSKACKRARRKCKRRLGREWKRGRFHGASCIRGA